MRPLTAEIDESIDALIATGEPLYAQWIAHSVCAQHAGGLADNEHSAFWRVGGYRTCRDEVRRCINRLVRGNVELADLMSRYDGFDHLQFYYLVERHDEKIGVPTDELTNEEIDAKISMYRTMGATCHRHADELEKFRKQRTSPPLFAEIEPEVESASIANSG